MTSIVELFPKCRKLAYDARQQLAQVERHTSSVGELNLLLEELHHQLQLMDDLVLKETPAQRQVWKRKISELRHEASTLQQQGQQAEYNRIHNHNNNNNTNNYTAQRQELLLRRRHRRNDDTDQMNLVDETTSLDQSHYMVNDLIGQGQMSLQELQQQRRQLRGIKGLVANINSRLGLSQATMRIIERRDITDAYLVFAGMVVTCLVIYFVWF